jgi:GNAT superfamily N-acetyltransferase
MRDLDDANERLARISAVSLSEAHLSELWRLWKIQYEEERSVTPSMPNTWSSRRESVESFLKGQTASEFAMVAQASDEIVGYMLFENFPFHGESTGFCSVTGHAEKHEYRRQVFEKLYQALSEKLAKKGVLNHAITYFAHDQVLKETVFELGFGMIVTDAFRKPDPLPASNSTLRIVQADPSQLDIVEALGDESREFYLEAPLFLKKKKQSRDYYRSLFDEQDSAILLAFIKDEPVGFMNIRKNKELDLMTLCDLNTGMIDPLGAFIKPAYRGRGIGKALLSKCIEWCENSDISQIHVDFESANLLARPFWPKYFTVAMNSVKRTLNKDAIV